MTTLQTRFWAKVDKTLACWLWTGSTKGNNHYGALRVAGRTGAAHRLSWMMHFGAIPAGLCVLHRCDKPTCVNPDHLFLGTQLENIADRDAKGRHGPSKGEANGRAKLGRIAVAVLRSVYGSTCFSQAELGRWFGVTQRTVSMVVRGSTWRPSC